MADKTQSYTELAEEEAITRWFIFDEGLMSDYYNWVRETFGDHPATIEGPRNRNNYTDEQAFEMAQTGEIQRILSRRADYISERKLNRVFDEWSKDNVPLRR